MRALKDAGCSMTVCAARLVGKCAEKCRDLVIVDGREIECEGSGEAELIVQGIQLKIKA